MHGVSRNAQVETPRLLLRRLCAADAESVFAMAADRAMWRFPEREPMSREEAWNLLLRHEGSWTVKGYGPFAVEEKSGGAFVGLAGFSDFRREIGPDFDPFPEITWSIVPSAQGRGYASEAAAAAVGWLEREVSGEQSVALIHTGNTASFAVARKLAYEAFRTIDYKDDPAVLLRRRSS